MDRVVVLDANSSRRTSLARTLRGAGLQVSAFGSIGEMERWPVGAVLLIDLPFFTPWWRNVGARDVMVLAATAESGHAACARGAHAWIPDTCTSETLVSLVKSACRRPHTPPRGPREGARLTPH